MWHSPLNAAVFPALKLWPSSGQRFDSADPRHFEGAVLTFVKTAPLRLPALSGVGFPHSGRTKRGRSPHSPPDARSRSSRRRRFGVLPLRRGAQQGPGLLGQEGPAGTIDAQNEGPSPTAGASSHRLLIRRPWFQSIPRSPPWPPQHSCRRCRSPSSDHSHSAR